MQSFKLLVLVIVLCVVIECSGGKSDRKKSKTKNGAIASKHVSGVKQKSKTGGNKDVKAVRKTGSKKEKESRKSKISKPKSENKGLKKEKKNRKSKSSKSENKGLKQKEKPKEKKDLKSKQKSKEKKAGKPKGNKAKQSDKASKGPKARKGKKSRTGKCITAETEREMCLKAHNILRGYYKDTPAFTYNQTLADKAKEWARKIADTGRMEHEGRTDWEPMGENLYVGPKNEDSLAVSKAVKGWFNELFNGTCQRVVDGGKDICGHFNQVMSTRSKQVGCAVSVSEDKDGKLRSFVVARYLPPGNMKKIDSVTEPKDEYKSKVASLKYEPRYYFYNLGDN